MNYQYKATKEYIDILEAIDKIRECYDDGLYDKMESAIVNVYRLLSTYSLLLNQFQIKTLLFYLGRTEERVGVPATLV